jgi:hypothetical protein
VRRRRFSEVQEYTTGEKVMCDFPFSGKPNGVCVEVVEEGNGREALSGKIRVRIMQDCKAYKKGEIVELNAGTAVPRKHVFTKWLTLRVDVNYKWVKPKIQQ